MKSLALMSLLFLMAACNIKTETKTDEPTVLSGGGSYSDGRCTQTSVDTYNAINLSVRSYDLKSATALVAQCKNFKAQLEGRSCSLSKGGVSTYVSNDSFEIKNKCDAAQAAATYYSKPEEKPVPSSERKLYSDCTWTEQDASIRKDLAVRNKDVTGILKQCKILESTLGSKTCVSNIEGMTKFVTANDSICRDADDELAPAKVIIAESSKLTLEVLNPSKLSVNKDGDSTVQNGEMKSTQSADLFSPYCLIGENTYKQNQLLNLVVSKVHESGFIQMESSKPAVVILCFTMSSKNTWTMYDLKKIFGGLAEIKLVK